MRPNHPARLAMWLRDMGWRVRQVNNRRIWYKGPAAAGMVAQNILDAERLEWTMQRTCPPSFMWGPDIAAVLGAAVEPIAPSPTQLKKAQLALDDLNSATFTNLEERNLFLACTARATAVLQRLVRAGQ